MVGTLENQKELLEVFPTQTNSNGPGPRGSHLRFGIPLYSGQYPSGISYLPPLQRPTLLPHSRVGSRARRPKGRCKHPLIGALPLMRICQSTSKTRQGKPVAFVLKCGDLWSGAPHTHRSRARAKHETSAAFSLVLKWVFALKGKASVFCSSIFKVLCFCRHAVNWIL